MKRTPKKRSVETNALKILMLQRGLSSQDLAQMCGLAPGTVRNVLCENQKRRKARRRIEDALQTPIWSPLEAFLARQTRNQGCNNRKKIT